MQRDDPVDLAVRNANPLVANSITTLSSDFRSDFLALENTINGNFREERQAREQHVARSEQRFTAVDSRMIGMQAQFVTCI